MKRQESVHLSFTAGVSQQMRITAVESTLVHYREREREAGEGGSKEERIDGGRGRSERGSRGDWGGGQRRREADR